MNSQQEICEVAINYFKDFLNDVEPISTSNKETMLNNILKLINLEKNDHLRITILEKEVKISTFQLGTNKALGTNSFLVGFFQYFWNIVGKELNIATKESGRRATMLRVLNNIFLALFLKKSSRIHGLLSPYFTLQHNI